MGQVSSEYAKLHKLFFAYPINHFVYEILEDLTKNLLQSTSLRLSQGVPARPDKDVVPNFSAVLMNLQLSMRPYIVQP